MPSFLAHADATLVALRPEQVFAMTIPGKVQTYLTAGPKETRAWTLRRNAVLPRPLLGQVVAEYRQNAVNAETVPRLAATSPLGQVVLPLS